MALCLDSSETMKCFILGDADVQIKTEMMICDLWGTACGAVYNTVTTPCDSVPLYGPSACP